MREKLIELLCQATFGVNKQTIPSYLPSSAIAEVADHLIANGVTFATDIKVGHWITKNGCTFCSKCMVFGSPQWKVCPVCETKMVGDELSPSAYNVSATNADRIRAMSDDELAEWLCDNRHCVEPKECPGYTACRSRGGVANGLKIWLKQPAEEGADHG